MVLADEDDRKVIDSLSWKLIALSIQNKIKLVEYVLHKRLFSV